MDEEQSFHEDGADLPGWAMWGLIVFGLVIFGAAGWLIWTIPAEVAR